jgi:hypothetical protein
MRCFWHWMVKIICHYFVVHLKSINQYQPFEDQKSEKGKIEMTKQLLKNLSDEKSHLIFYLIEFFQLVLECSEENKLDSKKLVQIFGPILLRPTKAEGK